MAKELTTSPGKIYYLIPELFKQERTLIPLIKAILKGRLKEYLKLKKAKKPHPIGGIKVIYQHCMLLKDLGFEVYPLLMGEYKGNYFGYKLDFKHVRDTGYELNTNDILVCPELTPYEGLKFKGAKKILFAQNWWQLYDRRLKHEDMGKSYHELGFERVMYCGDYIKEKLNKEPAENLWKVANYIDHGVFKPMPEKRKKGQVLALYRKRTDIIDKVAESLRCTGIDIKLVSQLTEEQIVKEYQTTDIFFASGFPEGFGLPPLEAMACGAAVVGFTGGGANEFMIENETALIAEDGDHVTVVEKIKRILSDGNLKERIRENGQNIAEKFNEDQTKKQLTSFYSSLMKQ